MNPLRCLAAPLLAALALATPAALSAAPPAGSALPFALPRGWQVERVVILMRHGVRSPDAAPPTIPGLPAPWPGWPNERGVLTDHGARAIALLAASDRAWLRSYGLVPPNGCPAAGHVAILANSFERTIRTAQVYAANVAPGCALATMHKPLGQPDPLFPSAANRNLVVDPARADAAARAAIGKGGLAAWDRRLQPLLARLNRILCGTSARQCGIHGPSTLEPATTGRPPRVHGSIERAAKASSALLLQYANGWPASLVGWGRATGDDITALTALVNVPYQITVRPPYLSSLETGLLKRRMAAALSPAQPARITVIVGHDGTIASLAGDLGLHWKIPGFAADFPSFGAGIGFAALRGPGGQGRVIAFFRGQSLEQIRGLSRTPAYAQLMPLRCGQRSGGDCQPVAFTRMLAGPGR